MNSKKKKSTFKDAPHKASQDDATGISPDAADATLHDTDAIPGKPREAPVEAPEEAVNGDAFKEKYLRLFAEYDNYRKRMAKEKEDLYRYAAENLIREMLPILDNFDRAGEHRLDGDSPDEYANGLALIEEQFRSVLAQAGLEAIEVVGQPFDPNLHDAVMQMKSEDFEAGIVAQEAQRGYTLNGRVIRHAKVVVSS